MYLLHPIEVGESIRTEYQREYEHERTKALVATEEIVRREEQLICERKLEEAKERWLLEQKKLLKEAKAHELKEIAKEKELQKQQLQNEFAAKMKDSEDMHQIKLQERLSEARKIAEEEKNEAIEQTRREESELAEGLAVQIKHELEDIKQEELLRQREEARKELEDHKEQLNKQHMREKDQLERTLNKECEERLSALIKDHERVVMASQQVFYDLVLENSRTVDTLRDTMDNRDYWKNKYESLKLEFSDFIDQFPGFKGDFLIK